MRAPRTAPSRIDDYEAREAANTIARAHQHLQNPKMMKAVQAHVDGLNKAVTGALKPKPMRRR